MTDRETIISILKELKPDVDYEKTTDLATGHILDFLEYVQLNMRLDDAFDINITPMDMVPSNYDSVDKILSLVKKKQEE
ncbi:MAG: acyl carrier protein [Bacilli bacterium]